MSVAQGKQSWVVTEHGVLVAYGHFAERVGLIRAIEQVPFKMKTMQHSAADKVLELLCHILAGGMHINELAKSAHPLLKDAAVARAWGQESFASSSGVSALLQVVSQASVTRVKEALVQVSAPYRQRILRESLCGPLVVDFDLTPYAVSDQATTYEGADFGHVHSGSGPLSLGRGYQFARAQLVGRKGVYVLGGFLHPGHTLSQRCLRELVRLTEAQVGHPRRRVAVVAARLATAEARLAAVREQLARKEAAGQPAPPEGRLRQQEQKWAREVAALQQRQDELAADNATNSCPRRFILRLDGGFGNAADLAWLYEQGYSVVARVQAHEVARGLRREVDLRPAAELRWEKVGQNLFILEAQRQQLGDCPYPVRLFLCRQWWGEKQPDRYSALVVTPDLSGKNWAVREVGVFYNGRQIIEAGNKESKGIFASRHLPTRHREGIELYQELVLFAQNMVRWFQRQFLGHTELAAASVAELVRIGARSRATVMLHGGVAHLCFVADSPWQGITLSLKCELNEQLWFPFLDDPSLAVGGT